jgi:dephospho-CoA kinase
MSMTLERNNSRSLIIGLTGPYCAGKNHIAALLERRGLPVLDVDKLGHQVIEIEKDAILARFGGAVLGENGSIDRKRLGNRVFGKPEELAALEGIIHPGVNRLTAEWINARQEKPCVINAALIHRSSVFERLDFIILVKAPVFIRLLRAKRRDRLSWGTLFKRFKSQKEFNSQYLKEKADIYTVNNGACLVFCPCLSRRALEKRIDAILSRGGIVQVS